MCSVERTVNVTGFKKKKNTYATPPAIAVMLLRRTKQLDEVIKREEKRNATASTPEMDFALMLLSMVYQLDPLFRVVTPTSMRV